MSFNHGFVTKVTTLGVAGATIGAAIWGIFGLGFNVFNILNCINLIIVTLTLLPAEFQVQFIKDGFGLIDNMFGKGLFVFFIGTWVICFYGKAEGSALGIYCLIVAIIDQCVGVLYMIFYFTFGEQSSAKM